MSEDAVVEWLSPDEAFKRVANEARFEILRALRGVDEPVAFGTLRDRAGVDRRLDPLRDDAPGRRGRSGP